MRAIAKPLQWKAGRPRGFPAPRALAGLVWLAAALLLAATELAGNAAAQISQPKFPELTGRVVDEAGIIKYEDRQELERELEALEAKSTDQVVVATVKSLQGYEIEEFGYQLGRKWGIGQKGKDNGVILIVAPNERKVRIEVGRRLEPILPDGLTGTIIRGRILPAFRRGDFSGGIRLGVKDITDVLSGDAEAVKERARGGVTRPAPEVDPMGLVILAIWIGIFILIIYLQMRQARQMPSSLGRNRRRGWNDGNVVVIPGGFGGGWSGGGDSGGGWSGGGGDFGGGGSSGSW
jgi:uncharacterized protein